MSHEDHPDWVLELEEITHRPTAPTQAELIQIARERDAWWVEGQPSVVAGSGEYNYYIPYCSDKLDGLLRLLSQVEPFRGVKSRYATVHDEISDRYTPNSEEYTVVHVGPRTARVMQWGPVRYGLGEHTFNFWLVSLRTGKLRSAGGADNWIDRPNPPRVSRKPLGMGRRITAEGLARLNDYAERLPTGPPSERTYPPLVPPRNLPSPVFVIEGQVRGSISPPQIHAVQLVRGPGILPGEAWQSESGKHLYVCVDYGKTRDYYTKDVWTRHTVALLHRRELVDAEIKAVRATLQSLQSAEYQAELWQVRGWDSLPKNGEGR